MVTWRLKRWFVIAALALALPLLLAQSTRSKMPGMDHQERPEGSGMTMPSSKGDTSSSTNLEPSILTTRMPMPSSTGDSLSSTSSRPHDTEFENVSCRLNLFIDHWNVSLENQSYVLFSDNGGHKVARFGNQLFTGAMSILKAVEGSMPLVVIPRMPKEIQKQIHFLPCLRSSRKAEEELYSLCEGCDPPNLWKDRNKSCNRGKGCKEHLQSKGILRDLVGPGFLQNLRLWPTLPANMTPREVLSEVFHVPVPKLEAVELPGPNDLVMHFRPYGSLFDIWEKKNRLQYPPFAFWKWTVEHHKLHRPLGRLWMVTTPGCRMHPTVIRLKEELGVEIFSQMDVLKKRAWLGDFAWLAAASSLALSFSTFSWWTGYVGNAATIYLVLPPSPLPLPWCDLFPKNDSRYIFYDFLNNESFTDADKAMQRCKYFDKAHHLDGSNLVNLVERFYPEVLKELGGIASLSGKLKSFCGV